MIHTLMTKHRQFFETGTTKSLDFRLRTLRDLQKALFRYDAEILDALRQDLNKSAFEAYESELGLVREELASAIRHLPRWAARQRVHTPLIHFPSTSFLYPEPYGTVLIMAPWNYPFHLAMIPLIGAVAAGNCCVLKPSEYALHTARIIEQIVREVFEEGHVSVVRGGRTANQSLLEETFDYIFFTGSPAVGHLVMESAARHLTPVTLELGGKSPCIVDRTADLPTAAKRIIWGKCLNAGQTCIAPDYLLVQQSVKAPLIAEMKKAIHAFYGEHPEENPDYPKIINEKHFERLKGLMQAGNLLEGGQLRPETRQIAPTLIDGVTPDDPIMQEEIFGPLLPVLTFDQIEEVFSFVSGRPKPLALYLFSTDEAVIRRTLGTLSFGGGCVNDTITHIANPSLPFGGVGNSGMGQYHGKRSFDTFTHQKAVLRKGRWPDVPVRYPPFRNRLSLLRKIL